MSNIVFGYHNEIKKNKLWFLKFSFPRVPVLVVSIFASFCVVLKLFYGKIDFKKTSVLKNLRQVTQYQVHPSKTVLTKHGRRSASIAIWPSCSDLVVNDNCDSPAITQNGAPRR